MRILLAPSERKRSGGGGPPLDPCGLLFPSLCEVRRRLLEHYEAIRKRGDERQLRELFGLKKEEELSRYRRLDPLASPTMKAVERYDGVAFDVLDYASLPLEAQNYIDSRLVIFSNLFGPVRADDPLPDYRLKQGSAVGAYRPERLYREEGSSLLDETARDEEILDLRAGFYDRFYKPRRPYTTLKFLKEGKSVSHWAKAYRGKVLRAAALAGADSVEELLALPFEDMELVEIRKRGIHTEVLLSVRPA